MRTKATLAALLFCCSAATARAAVPPPRPSLSFTPQWLDHRSANTVPPASGLYFGPGPGPWAVGPGMFGDPGATLPERLASGLETGIFAMASVARLFPESVPDGYIRGQGRNPPLTGIGPQLIRFPMAVGWNFRY